MTFWMKTGEMLQRGCGGRQKMLQRVGGGRWKMLQRGCGGGAEVDTIRLSVGG